jgi:zeta-carotene isomerase
VSAAAAGEDAAVFEWGAQKASSWRNFSLVLAVVTVVLYVVWLDPNLGVGDDVVGAFQESLGDPHLVMLGILFLFAVVHSGGAALRPQAERVLGAKAYRVLFAGASLPLAVTSVVYFINHRYSGVPLWDLRGVPGVHDAVWWTSLVSFLFLYPSTFNLLEVAAVDEPRVHLYETGIMRITRHPQAVGQGLWCAAHTLWVGNSFMVVTSLGLMAHHLFGVWHGDQRLKAKHGAAFDDVASRTSVWPFAAILDGRQQLPADYWREFARAPYVAVIGFTLGAYWAHPYLQAAAFKLGW